MQPGSGRFRIEAIITTVFVIVMIFSVLAIVPNQQTIPESQSVMDYSFQLYGNSTNNTKTVQVQMDVNQTLQFSFSFDSLDISSATLRFSIIVPQADGIDAVYYQNESQDIQGIWSSPLNNTYFLKIKNNDTSNPLTPRTIVANVVKNWTSIKTDTILSHWANQVSIDFGAMISLVFTLAFIIIASLLYYTKVMNKKLKFKEFEDFLKDYLGVSKKGEKSIKHSISRFLIIFALLVISAIAIWLTIREGGLLIINLFTSNYPYNQYLVLDLISYVLIANLSLD